MPTMPPPYVIANVALEEVASVRLTTNVVGCEPDDVRLGQEVAVRFAQQGDVFLPLFEPTGGPDAPDRVPEPTLPPPRAPLRDEARQRVVKVRSVSVRVHLGVRSTIHKNKTKQR